MYYSKRFICRLQRSRKVRARESSTIDDSMAYSENCCYFILFVECWCRNRYERIYIGWSDATDSMVTILSPFCGYNTTQAKIYRVIRIKFNHTAHLVLTLCGLTSRKTHRGGLRLGGSVHEEAHPCFPYLVQPSFKGTDAGSIYHPLVQLIPSINERVYSANKHQNEAV